MQARDIMTETVVTAKPEQTVEEVAKIFIEEKISGIPVVDKDNKVIGIISEGDLVFQQKKVTPPVIIRLFDGILELGQQKFYQEMKKIAAYKVEDLMTGEVIAVEQDTDINDVATLMVNHNINRVPVLAEDKKLLGIITRHDIIKNIYK
ncbi:MAG: CBS domain-containing protein [Peptococcaceae bacterium]